jgi:sortase A
VVVFVAYQWWGSGLVEHRDQARLRAELARELTGRRLSGPVTGIDRPRPPAAANRPVTAPGIPVPGDGQPVGTLVIPSIGVDQVVVEGVGAAQLAMGPGHYPGTPLPGQAGNAAIAGHRTTHGHPFYDLQALIPGDDIEVTTVQGVFVYVVVGQSVVDPGDTAVIGPTAEPTLTLTTCTPRYSAAQRLVVRADLSSSALYDPPVAAPDPPATLGRRSSGSAGRLPGDGSPWWGTLAWATALLVGLAVGALAGRRIRPAWAAYAATAPPVMVAALGLCIHLDPLLPAGF